MSKSSCCRHLKQDDLSPFEIVQLGWWDGVTRGMARCRECRATYYFDMVSWDLEHEVRVYAFREIALERFESVASLCERPAPSAGLRQEHDDMLLRRVRDALATNYEWSLYVASSDLARRIIVARTISFGSWMEILAK